MKKLIPIFLIFLIIISFTVFIDEYEKNKLSLSSIKKCNELDYDNHEINSIENLSEIEIHLIFDEEMFISESESSASNFGKSSLGSVVKLYLPEPASILRSVTSK